MTIAEILGFLQTKLSEAERAHLQAPKDDKASMAYFEGQKHAFQTAVNKLRNDLDPPDIKENIQRLQGLVSTAEWNLNFHQFCAKTGLNAKAGGGPDQYSLYRFEDLRKLKDALHFFDAETLALIIS